MKIILLCTGKTDVAFVAEAINIYAARIKHYAPIAIEVIEAKKQWKKLGPAERIKAEGEMQLKALKKGDFPILLDDKGKSYSSEKFSEFIEKRMVAGTGRLVFIVGGAFGFSPELYKAVPQKLSLSAMTFSHQMVRPILLEQVYRAFTILRNEPYHNG
jgi:23S rRNA (pseudouridine1915-N3)-methyltransferase